MRSPRYLERGFTLVELLVVIAIIAVLATIILPGMGKIRRDAKIMKCANNLKGLYAGLIMYESEFRGYPRGDDGKGKQLWETLRTLPSEENAILRKKDDIFICPVSGKDSPAKGTCHYRGPVNEVSDAWEDADPLGADDETNHDSGRTKNKINILYWGGTINTALFGSQEFDEASEALQE
ncbi:MAG: type II secretion system protein [Planctomycetota bacterium]|nr:type II secretion system protein [Planctomycetota bacterium]MDI6788593.1 type II secretion system protein [Planctomycetota bacterium]